MTVHRLNPSSETLHGTFSPDFAPVLTIEPGDTVIVRTLDAQWTVRGFEDLGLPGDPERGLYTARDAQRDTGHALCGPIRIEGAEPGMVLEVQIGEIVPGDYGWNFGSVRANGINERLGLEGETLRVTWAIDPAAGTSTSSFGHRVRIAPFFGVMGMPPDLPGLHPTSPPRPTGGNIDCRELVAGTTLFLPIAVPGGLFSMGDGHARQGDGEVSTTAIECPIQSGTLTFFLRDDLPIATPLAWTPEAWIAMGFDADLDEAALIALNAMLDLMQRQFGIERTVALSLASAVVDLRVTQIVNGVRGVHAMLRHDAVERVPPTG
ncbi:MAG TPA: acetamidase/formamidase family protein [Thermomicrobiales bacterium]|nr:acetamidase/formamidase family protein [Thermomicrobiales bacterium]